MGGRNWKRQANRGKVDEVVMVIGQKRFRDGAEGMDEGLAVDH